MHPLKVLSRSAFVLTLALVTRSAALAETYRDAERHFTLEIPPGWCEMEPAEVAAFNHMRAPSPWTPKLMYTAGFRRKEEPPGTGPITLILAYDPVTLGEGSSGFFS